MLVLPRKDKEGNCYISYSQHSKWKYSKKDYIKSYFFGERFEGNAYTDFGSKIGEALENNDFSGFDRVEKTTLKKVTRLDQFEREIKWDLGSFYVMGYIDTNDVKITLERDVVTTLIDYKTGDLNKVATYEDDKYDQLAIYAGAIEQETGVLPTSAHVELIERTGNAFRGEPLALGKEVVEIPQDITPKKIKKVKAEVIKVATEIAEHYEVFNKMNSITV